MNLPVKLGCTTQVPKSSEHGFPLQDVVRTDEPQSVGERDSEDV